MVDWNNPSTSQTHSNELASTKGRDESNAIMDYSADSNIPDGTIRWDATASRFEIWDATNTVWNELDAEYAINVSTAEDAKLLDGRDTGASAGNIPVNDGNLNASLNADYLDGEHGSFYDDAPNGTTMLFYQSSAPTGWSQDTSINDRVLRVVSGNGGGNGGSWTISGLNVQGHTLTEAEMPSHNHGNGSLWADGAGNHNHGGGNHSHAQRGSGTTTSPGSSLIHLRNDLVGGAAINNANNTAGSGNIIGNDGFHGHNISGSTSNAGSDNPHDHGISHDGNWRPSYIDVIAATRSK